jgi:hypothetical protein
LTLQTPTNFSSLCRSSWLTLMLTTPRKDPWD